MFRLKNAFFGERSVTKVVGAFDSEEAAREVARKVVDESLLTNSQVRVLTPSEVEIGGDAVIARAVEPETRGIWHTLLRAHASAGLIGLLAGVLLFAFLMGGGVRAVVSSPVLSFIALAGFGLIFGLLVGGALSLRPDHGRVIAAVRDAVSNGQWAVVAHPQDAQQTDLVVAYLESRSDRVVRTL
ncbi:MAG: hypothetical protein H2060_02680 [Azoarcus sp.]|nr:hypothetical protein [Azoarcus sp.]